MTGDAEHPSSSHATPTLLQRRRDSPRPPTERASLVRFPPSFPRPSTLAVPPPLSPFSPFTTHAPSAQHCHPSTFDASIFTLVFAPSDPVPLIVNSPVHLHPFICLSALFPVWPSAPPPGPHGPIGPIVSWFIRIRSPT
ncbi:hypothetical protein HETIRDRAFT_104518 [Heterobasidion irregulare TC 32-1]|uniref:Uncharacterized protein n=1 Tax=Heterobasidion irregulare (strain TC 32-1) TaxID=747525 RepID=W4K1M6_HETIT|nr:uncharacterized protein HETIRDRAFT_104518 [Heterobasidion irregulare TC 32-1]ETW79245.1 hypothetical protein HETIRDRAFT_104518 [Heterobasidion irregulare TC 32-1]